MHIEKDSEEVFPTSRDDAIGNAVRVVLATRRGRTRWCLKKVCVAETMNLQVPIQNNLCAFFHNHL